MAFETWVLYGYEGHPDADPAPASITEPLDIALTDLERTCRSALGASRRPLRVRRPAGAELSAPDT